MIFWNALRWTTGLSSSWRIPLPVVCAICTRKFMGLKASPLLPTETWKAKTSWSRRMEPAASLTWVLQSSSTGRWSNALYWEIFYIILFYCTRFQLKRKVESFGCMLSGFFHFESKMLFFLWMLWASRSDRLFCLPRAFANNFVAKDAHLGLYSTFFNALFSYVFSVSCKSSNKSTAIPSFL